MKLDAQKLRAQGTFLSGLSESDTFRDGLALDTASKTGEHSKRTTFKVS